MADRNSRIIKEKGQKMQNLGYQKKGRGWHWKDARPGPTPVERRSG